MYLFFSLLFSLLFKIQEDEEKPADADVRKNYFQVHFLSLCCVRICAMTCVPRGKTALLMDSSVFFLYCFSKSCLCSVAEFCEVAKISTNRFAP